MFYLVTLIAGILIANILNNFASEYNAQKKSMQAKRELHKLCIKPLGIYADNS
ncbi:MAG: hypothetical protein P8J51_05530 [Dehalococcoidia bacterium]|nr:hypothetical protein [Dehalococcoidia bacterium]